MTSWTRTGLVMTLLLAACTDKDDPTFGQVGGDGGADGGTDGGTDGGSDGGGGDGGGTDGGGTTETSGFDEPGDIVTFADQDGEASVFLGDESGDSNLSQQFYMVVVNTGSAALGYQIRYDTTGSTGAPTPEPRLSTAAPSLSPHRQALKDALRDGSLSRVQAVALTPPPLGTSDIGVAEREFKVRNSMVSDSSYSTSSATLWGIGETVAIWVDEGVPIDWDIDCDGVVDVPAEYDAYGFDNCDLAKIVGIVDYNIVPNLRTLFGAESDENGDGLVSVLITPELNVISYTSDDEDEQGSLVPSYADPEVDLTEWNGSSNPGSNEQEIIYVFAPDPYGFLNPGATATVDEYTSMELSAQIARSFFELISYNQHVLVSGGEEEEEWLTQGLGALAADLTGFGAVYYDDAWDYLDHSHLQALVSSETSGSLSTSGIGAQYLFARYLHDRYGAEILASLVQVEAPGATRTPTENTTIGTGLIESVTGQDFDDLVVQWQVALLTTGVDLPDGTPLISDADYPPYDGSTTLTAPSSSPSSGDYYGANGYQEGIEIRGTNRYMEGGTTDRPLENTGQRVVMSGQDFGSAVTGIENWGYVEGSYAAQVVRLTDITLDSAYLNLQGQTSGFVGAVVRWEDRDLLSPDVVVEQIFSATKADNVELPDLPGDGSAITGVGEITSPGYSSIVADDEEAVDASVYDTDRWLLTLSGVAPGDFAEVSIHLSRRYADGAGDAAPFDPWISVVPEQWIPTPTVEGTQRGSCAEGVDFQYPSTMLDYLFYQLYLSPDAGLGVTEVEDEFTCGEVTPGTSCGEDWDRDGILDADELLPETFVDQVNAMLCTLNGNDASLFQPVTATDLLDIDSLDDDDISWFDRSRNLGGQSDASGEEASIVATLEGGQDYLVIVGAGTYTGSYDLEIRRLD